MEISICPSHQPEETSVIGRIHCVAHCNDVIMTTLASQITGLMIVYSIIYIQGADQRKHQSSVSLTFTGNSPVTGEFPTQRTSNAENVFVRWRHHVSANTLTEHVWDSQKISCENSLSSNPKVDLLLRGLIMRIINDILFSGWIRFSSNTLVSGYLKLLNVSVISM